MSLGSCESGLRYLNGIYNLLMQRKSVRFVIKRKLEKDKERNLSDIKHDSLFIHVNLYVIICIICFAHYS